MISKQEILSAATATGLLGTTVEKDYALSWALFGISKHPKLSEWIFKGGTCLKKCYFETYRFSEDLDYTVPKGAIYGLDEIKAALGEVAGIVYEAAGIEIKVNEIEVTESVNKKGSKTYEAKLTYLGPLGLASRARQRIKFDITDDEILVDASDVRAVFHAYSDAPSPPAQVKCYSINEILAEKTRAIYERQGRARDVYDVVNISRNFREDVNINKARSGLIEKFKFKQLPAPTVDLVLSRIDLAQLQANWEDQLAHQLPVLPTADSFYNDLRPALSWWIDENPTEPALLPISSLATGARVPRTHFPEVETNRIGIGRQANTASMGGRWAGHLDQIRYAARNRLCIKIQYHGVERLVEPYSLRLPGTGNLLLYVYELARGTYTGGGIKAYKVSEIANTEITRQPFSPRYAVEL
jgi:predicted nucleotidyltransferase component of viral defense system